MESITFSPRQLWRTLFGFTALISLAGLAAELCDHVWSPDWAGAVVPLLSLSYEQNVPTWYAVCLHAQCALLCLWSQRHEHQRGGRHGFRWGALAAAFGYISIDELVEIHEAAGGLFETDGVLYFDWVIPGAAITLVLGLWFLPLVWSLTLPTRIRVITAGVVFVTGALIMELPLGYWTDQYGSDNLGYGLIDWIEETFELVGLTLFIRALIARASDGAERVRLGLAVATAPDAGSDLLRPHRPDKAVVPEMPQRDHERNRP